MAAPDFSKTSISNVAFDFDGVLIPDLAYIPGGHEVFLEYTLYIKPIFHPRYNYSIITGRVAERRPYTQKWLEQLEVQPERLFHDNINTKEPWLYKADVLNAHPEFKLYVESDTETVDYLRSHTKTRIVHFDKWLCQMTRVI